MRLSLKGLSLHQGRVHAAELPWLAGSPGAEGTSVLSQGPNPGCVPQVLRGCEDAELQELHLQRNPALYSFTRQGAGLSVSGYRRHWAPSARVPAVEAPAGPGGQGAVGEPALGC